MTFEYEESYVPVTPLPHHIQINVTGLGWQLLRKSLGLNLVPLAIPLESPGEVKKIVGASLPAIFSPQLEGFQINFILSDTLHIHLDKKSTKEVHLKIDSIERYLKNEYVLASNIGIQPEVVILEGPQCLLNTLPDTLSLLLSSNSIDKSYNDEVEVELESEMISRNPPVVSVDFSVDKSRVITDTVFLQVINLPKEFKPVVRAREIIFTYRLPESQVNSISGPSVTAELDLNGFERGRYKLVPTITGLPAFSKVIKIDTIDINF